jgi:uncharacterized protein (DUF2235 family)
MGKNIVICSDGMGNIAMKDRGTKVFKLYEAVDIYLEEPRQVTIYDDGVGTQSFNPYHAKYIIWIHTLIHVYTEWSLNNGARK